MKQKRGIDQLLEVMARLRSPTGCPWDREQTHLSLRWHAVEEVYELLDAIESGDDHELKEELGDLLLQVVFHAQLAGERSAFDFDAVAAAEAEKLIRRHPHVFGSARVRDVEGVWTQWERIKREEKAGTHHERASALDGIPRALPALMRAQKLLKKAEKAKLLPARKRARISRRTVARKLLACVEEAHAAGYSAEELLREELAAREKKLRRLEKKSQLVR